MSDELKVRNTPSLEGAELGRQIARLTPVVPEMCASCAFRLGTFPNRCSATVLAAVRCVVEGTTFYCHVHTDEAGREAVCEGFLSALRDPDWGADINCHENKSVG